MGVEFSIDFNDTEVKCVIMTGANGWKNIWLPTAEKLQLNLIPSMADGAFTPVPTELIPEVIRQLVILGEWMKGNQPENARYYESIIEIIEAITSISKEDLPKYSLYFG